LNSKSLPFISIIIPTYNHASFIGKALKSVQDQTYKNWEAIIIDNHSTDETRKVISKYKDPRIKYLKIFNKGIIAKSRNLGIQVAKGEWIAFLDSDDWWTKDKLEICSNNISNTVDLVYHDLEIVYVKSGLFFKKKKYQGRQLNKPILNDLLFGTITKGNAIGNSSVIVRKNLISKIGGISENKNLVASEDYHTWLRIAKISDQFTYLKKKLGYYLIHDKSAQKRDLSIPHREAINDFLKLFNNQQRLSLEVKLKYMSGNYNNLKNNFSRAKEDFKFVMKNGGVQFKIRSFLKFLLIIIKNGKIS